MVKIDNHGNSLVYSILLGGIDRDVGLDVAVGNNGFAYVTGFTYSSDFPTTYGAFDPTFNGGSEAFVTKLDKDGTALIYSTYLGSSGDDSAHRVSIDNRGHAYIVGDTLSESFPVTDNAFDNSFNGHYDVFVSELNENGTSLIYSTYLGGNGWDAGWGSAIGNYGHVYVVGWTSSNNFPSTLGVFDQTFNGEQDVFVAKYDLGAVYVRDTIPPVISNIRASSPSINSQHCSSPTVVIIHANVSDVSDLAWVRLYYRSPGTADWAYVSMVQEEGNRYSARLGPFATPGQVAYYVRARDVAGNENTSLMYYLTVNPCTSHMYLPMTWTQHNIGCSHYEPNDDRRVNPWGPLQFGVTYAAYLCRGDEEDNYYFQVSDTRPVRVQLHLPPSLKGHTALWVYWDGDLAAPICGLAPVTNVETEISCPLSHVGRYIIRLYTADSNRYFDEQTPYELVVSR